MSNSFFERANPPPRRKTCVACTKAKRRCDHGQPACLRCSRRKIDCVYQSPPSARSRSQTSCHTPQSLGTPLAHEDPNSTNETAPPAEGEEPYSSTSLIPWSEGFDLLPLSFEAPEDIVLDIGFGELLDPDVLLDGTLSTPSLTTQTDHMLVPQQQQSPVGFLEEIIASRLQYALDEIQKFTASIVLENKTPWIHQQLYRTFMPREMQDAQACCALYMAKNPSNAPAVLRTIQARSHELLASPMPRGRLEILARVHAILLYQIIRLFDGDISLRASAQNTLSSLEPAITALVPFVKWHPEQPVANSAEETPTKDFWQDWIFQESARRTIFFTCFFLIAHQMLVGQQQTSARCEEKYIFCQSWTLSAHLWNAPNVVDFAVAWKEKRHFVITKQCFSEVLRDAAADDVDLFGRILMVGAMGIEEARLWFYNRGGAL
ncbi:hypothetical protein CCHL11_06133 [Colletotrichum chlorophyti]|uniref:Zn(2)-C6 fungal-type domain-containing protein n=1 Tax=Colletotrichum chlorophyti TaxID=708187 RepID=A0A1Q8RT73_9PEZI|nr:hypothetical protein CCHL11_06133 [Colletotrichum chlorophyti]